MTKTNMHLCVIKQQNKKKWDFAVPPQTRQQKYACVLLNPAPPASALSHLVSHLEHSNLSQSQFLLSPMMMFSSFVDDLKKSWYKYLKDVEWKSTLPNLRKKNLFIHIKIPASYLKLAIFWARWQSSAANQQHYQDETVNN